jgi:hypothetical protein
MKTLRYSIRITATALILVFATTAMMCQKQPQNVANVLTSLGNIKRAERASGALTAQQDLDISRKLDAANRSYRKFVTDEQARVAAGTTDPAARTAALNELRSLLSGLGNPSVLGIKSAKAVANWNAGVAALNTILIGLGG